MRTIRFETIVHVFYYIYIKNTAFVLFDFSKTFKACISKVKDWQSSFKKEHFKTKIVHLQNLFV